MPPPPRKWLPDEDAIIRRMRESGATWDAITLALASVGAPMRRPAVINRSKAIGMIEPNCRKVGEPKPVGKRVLAEAMRRAKYLIATT